MVKSILITGASGYLGSSLLACLSNYKLYAISRNFPEDKNDLFPNVNFIAGDLNEESTFLNALSLKPNIVIHTISLDHKMCEAKDIKEVFDVNVLLTWKLLEGFSNNGVEKFINFSTVQVYGNNLKEKLELPKNKYGLTHLLSEEIVNFHNSQKLSCVNLRICNCYGPPIFKNNNWDSLVINQLTKSIYYKNQIFLASDGSAQKSFLNINEFNQIINEVVMSEERSYFPIDICSGNTISIIDLAQLIISVYEKRYDKNPETNIYKILSNRGESKLKTFKSKNYYSLEKGINDLFDFFENQ